MYRRPGFELSYPIYDFSVVSRPVGGADEMVVVEGCDQTVAYALQRTHAFVVSGEKER